MKFFAVVCMLVFALLAVVFGLKDPVCGQPPENTGVCLAAFRKYSYHADSNSCREFIYGGCGGNDNRFETLEDCEKRCKE